jgi:hypothetical protein
MPFYPQFNVNPLDLADQAAAAVEAGEAPDVAAYVANALAAGTIKMAVEDPDAPENWATHADVVALQSLRFFGQRQRVLPQVPAWNALQRDADRKRRPTARRRQA